MIPTVLFLRSLILTLHSYIHKSSGKSGNITIFLLYLTKLGYLLIVIKDFLDIFNYGQDST